jgi:type IV pilus assembly protein PilQ
MRPSSLETGSDAASIATGGMMRRTLRVTATGTALVLAAGLGCAARGTGTTQPSDLAAANPLESSGAKTSQPAAATKHLTRAAFSEDADGARLVISASAPMLYTSYDPRHNLLVVDLPNFGVADNFTAPPVSGDLVESIRVEPIQELGKNLTRVTIAYREGVKYDIRSAGEGLAVAFELPGASASAEATADKPTVVAEEFQVAVPIAAEAEPPVRGELAHSLEEIVVDASGSTVVIKLLGDGFFAPKDFVLDNPPRIVVDLPGVKNEVRRRTIPVKGALVSRVRVAQFQKEPDLVTRVVVDLVRPMPHLVKADGERLALLVGVGLTAAAVPEALAPAAPSAPSRTVIAEVPAHPEPMAPVVTAASEPTVQAAERPVARPAEQPAPAELKRAEPPAALPAVSDTASQAPEKPAVVETVVAQAPAPVPVPGPASASPAPRAAAPVKVAQTPAKLPPGVRKAQKSALPAPAAVQPENAAAKAKQHKDDALFEAAAAVLDEQEAGKPGDPQAPGGATFQSRTLAESQSQFTGEPISLDLKDADIKDVFRTISQLTGLNIVIDPEVRGNVTVQLEDVPWDQALDLILKQNSLGYVLENNIMRIATSAKLQAEQSDRARLADARQAAEPTRTVIKKLSYAKAGDVTSTIKSVMSKRGDIVVDARTNTLIIREIPTYLPAVLQLIDNLDTATPQVMIESRIVETTKSLGRSLGINWGFTNAQDVAHGNTTGLIFPNSIGSTFRVPLDAGSTVGSISMANILGSFNLDVALTAAENQGLLKIISSPKVTALTNTAASIQSGTQIPVQTNVNNTTTVIYVDATLKLTVTPQITAEGTVLLDVDVMKREPAVALNLALGQNVPLTVRQYKGQVLVRDGGTTVIGGIFQLNDQDQNNMIPGLWKIPIFGNLFRNKTRTEKHDELLIFITPRIIRS